MSDVIDSRVVELQFDNKEFEERTKQSMTTLEKLKNVLRFDKTGNGIQELTTSLSGVNQAVSKIDANPIAQSFNRSLSLAESYMQLFNYKVANFVQNTQQKLVGMIITDPIRDGFKEYETQLDSVQTILANTSEKGTTLGEVNAALKELNDYADKTIYNFTQMTQNIGRFTAAGLDLDVSTKAIQGISNLAAVSGSTSQQASTAMYQLSQALSTGALKLQDWNSVVNAGMGGQVFQEALKRTAKAHGEAVDDMIKKAGSFRESLKDGWITTDILSETLNQFAGAYDDAQLAQMGYTEEQIKSIQSLAKTAEDAATKVKTFSQLVDTTKEALGSGWTTTWQYIFGDFEQAKELWTSISDYTNDIINSAADKRNNFLSELMPSNWDRTSDSIQKAGVSMDDFKAELSGVYKDATRGQGDLNTVIEKYGTLGEAVRKGAVSSTVLRKTIENINDKRGGGFADLAKGAGLDEANDKVKKIQQALVDVGGELSQYGIDGRWGDETQKAIEKFQKDNNLEITGKIDDETFKALNNQLEELGKTVLDNNNLISLDWVDEITKLGGRDLIIYSLQNAFQGLLSVINPIKEAFDSVFHGPTVDEALAFLEQLEAFTSTMKLSDENTAKLKNTFEGLFTVVYRVFEKIGEFGTAIFGSFFGAGSILDNILSITSAIADWIKGTDEVIDKTGILSASIGIVKQAFSTVSTMVTNLVSFIANPFQGMTISEILTSAFTKLKDTLASLWPTIKTVFGEISKFVTDTLVNLDLNDIFTTINAGLIGSILLKVRKLFNGKDSLSDILKSFFGVDGLKGGVKEILDSISESLESFTKLINVQAIKDIAVAIGILAASLWVLSTIDTHKLEDALIAVSILIWEISAAIKFISGGLTGGSTLKDAFTNLLGGLNVAVTSTAMISLAGAVLILSFAMSKLAKLDWDGIGKGLVAIGGLLLELGIFAKTMDGVKINLRTSVAFIAVAAAVNILANAMGKLADIDSEGLKKGLIAIGLALLEIAGFIAILSKIHVNTMASIATVIIAAAINMLVPALQALAKVDGEALKKGLSAIGLALLAVAGFIVLLDGVKGSFTSGVSLLVIAAAINALVPALQALAKVDGEGLKRSLAAIGVALLEIVSFIKLMSGTKGAIGSAASVLIIAAALNLLVPVIQKLGALSAKQLAKGIGTIAVAMLTFAAAMAIMGKPGSIAGAAAILIMVAALGALVPIISLLGNMSVETIAKGLIAIAVAMGIFVAAAAAIAGISLLLFGAVPAILALSGGLAAFGAAMIIVGAGCAVLAFGLSSIIDLATNGAESIASSIITISTAILEAIPVAAKAIATAIVTIIAEVARLLPQSVSVIAPAIIELLKKLETYIPQFVTELVNLAIKIATNLAEELPRRISGIWTAIKGLGGSLLDGIFGEGTSAKVGNFLDNLLEDIKKGFIEFPGKVAKFFETFWDEGGGADKIANAVNTFVTTLGGWILKGMKRGVDTAFGEGTSTKIEKFFDDMVKGFKELPDKIAKFFETFWDEGGGADKIASAVNTFVTTCGNWILKGLSWGVDNAFGEGTSAEIEKFVDNAVKDFKELPGKVVETLDTFWDEGGALDTISEGVGNYLGKVVSGIGRAVVNFNDGIFGEGTSEAAAGLFTDFIDNISQQLTDLPGQIATVFGSLSGQFEGSKFTQYASAMSGGVETVLSINFKDLETTMNGINSLVAMAETVSGIALDEGTDLYSFGAELQMFGSNLTVFYADISEMNTKKFANIGNGLKDLVTAASETEGITLSDSLKGFFGDAGTDGTIGILSSFTDKASSELDSLSSMFSDNQKSVATSVTGYISSFDEFKSKFDTTFNGIDSTASAVMSGLSTAMSGTGISADAVDMSGITSAASTAVTTATKTLSGATGKFSKAANENMDAFVKAMSGYTSQVASVASRLSSSAASALGSAAGSASSYGVYFAQGFANGMESYSGFVRAKAAALGAAALKSLKETIDSNSPSKETTKLGDYFGWGFFNGISEWGSKVGEASNGLGESALASVKMAGQRISDVLNGTLVMDPTIKPVVDLSNVQSGVAAIDDALSGSSTLNVLSNIGYVDRMMSNRPITATNDDVVNAIGGLRKDIGNLQTNQYNIDGITYDDGSNISDVVRSLIHAAKLEGRT